MRTTTHQAATIGVASAALATSVVVGLAGHWFVAWLVLLVDGIVVVAWNVRVGRVAAATGADIAAVRAEHAALRADLERTRHDTRASQHLARAELELLRAEFTVAANPDDPSPGPEG